MTYFHLTRKRFFLWFLVVFSIASNSGCTSDQDTDSQTADDQWSPTVTSPEFPQGDGPVVLVDAAHGNFHTIDGRYSAFAELLELDGFRVQSANSEVTPKLLGQASVFVISNAVFGGDDAVWTLPTPPAFTSDEIEVIVDWVDKGGSLLLIADHMPFPGGTADLANEFGIVFLNGFAMKSVKEGGMLSFTRSSGSLADHAITRGRSESEMIESITSFTGQAFRFVAPVQPLMYMPDDWKVLLPIEAWVFDESTPFVSARGLIQGGVLRHGAGRVAVFGEAAMFTAQTSVSDGVVSQMGLNHPSATANAQFVLNVMHWLAKLVND
ncbi:MAG: DUF4350 domain-containing protein [Proteobacteria bacterium]|nr:DUF4350 domain-containing protein [Pseudomonadota bacterium]